MKPWFRHFLEESQDPRLTLVARRLDLRLGEVAMVWMRVQELAELAHAQGGFSQTAEEIAVTLDFEPEMVQTVLNGLAERGMIVGSTVTDWAVRHQPSDSSAERMRRKREKDRAEQGEVTDGDGSDTVTPSQLRKNRIEENREDRRSSSVPRKEPPKTAAASPPRSLTPAQKVLEEAWTHCGLEGKPGGKGYSNASGAVAKHGIPLLREWLGATMFEPPRLPEGGNPSLWFGETIRAALAQPFNWPEGGPQRLNLDDNPFERELADPSGTAFGSPIDDYKRLWLPWTDVANNGDRQARLKLWGEAIRPALKKPPDLAKLAAGPPEVGA